MTVFEDDNQQNEGCIGKGKAQRQLGQLRIFSIPQVR